MNLWQCSLCCSVGLWDEGWSAYSSLLINDEWPSYRLILCSPACKERSERWLASGKIKLPRFKMGYLSKMTHPPVGYKAQPEQRELLKLWNKRNARVVQPNK